MTPVIRLKPGESSDSGFCSTPALTTQVSLISHLIHVNFVIYFFLFSFLLAFHFINIVLYCFTYVFGSIEN